MSKKTIFPGQNDVEIEELDQLIRTAKKMMWFNESAHRYVQSQGVIIEPNRFYSERPSIADIENSFEFRDDYAETGPYFDKSILDLSVVEPFMASVQKFADEFTPPQTGDDERPESFYWQNKAFSKLDALSYWCMIRKHRPKRVIEIGSGFSTIVANMALKKNGSGELICIEPFPKPWLTDFVKNDNLIKSLIQDIPVQDLNDMLSEGDILFIDSTHTVKIGSDCLYIYLKLLPNIDQDIIVHVHDILLPFVRDQKSAIDKHVHWTEQYLLTAYLIDNPRTNYIFSSRVANRFFHAAANDFINHQYEATGGSFWFTQKKRI